MSKVLTFSRYFPAYHPKAGQPTYFAENLTHSLQLLKPKMSESFFETLTRLNPSVKYKAQIDFFVTLKWDKKTPKHHTIRAGHRFKAGDKFSPRVWSGKPYRSKQIIIAPDIEVKKVWNFKVDKYGGFYVNDVSYEEEDFQDLASNDGLSAYDFFHWFIIKSNKKIKPFDGQIICWNENINY